MPGSLFIKFCKTFGASLKISWKSSLLESAFWPVVASGSGCSDAPWPKLLTGKWKPVSLVNFLDCEGVSPRRIRLVHFLCYLLLAKNTVEALSEMVSAKFYVLLMQLVIHYPFLLYLWICKWKPNRDMFQLTMFAM